MNRRLLDQVVQTVLYEGYILYPYRASSTKNQQRFTFGRVYPEAYSEAEGGVEPSLIQTECLAEATASWDGFQTRPTVRVAVRFLQPMARQIRRLANPLPAWIQDQEPSSDPVPELSVDGNLFKTWHEVVEREIELPELVFEQSKSRPPGGETPLKLAGEDARVTSNAASTSDIATEKISIGPHFFSFPASRTVEPIADSRGQVPGLIERRQEAVQGMIELFAQPLHGTGLKPVNLEGPLFKITVRISNQAPMQIADLADPAAVLMRTFASTHAILQAEGADFISLLEVPAQHKAAAAQCRNIGTWPVLVGDAAKRERDTMLSSPIILYDYPRIAPESPGPLFDGTEIDEILTLRIMAMTDEEKHEMRQVDAQARRLLERTESLEPQDLARMHGEVRELRSVDSEIFGSNKPLEGVSVGGVYLRVGDRVRLRPKARADVFDLVLNGKTAVVEAVEQDAESRVHLAVVVEDDPGRDLGFERLSGHRFFYGPEEVEPVGVQ